MREIVFAMNHWLYIRLRNRVKIQWAYVRAHTWCMLRILQKRAPVVRTTHIEGGWAPIEIATIGRTTEQWWDEPPLKVFLTGRDLLP